MSRCRVICMFHSLHISFEIQDLNPAIIVLTDGQATNDDCRVHSWLYDRYVSCNYWFRVGLFWSGDIQNFWSRESIGKLRDLVIPLRELVPEQFIPWNSLLNKLEVSLPSADCKWRLSAFITTELANVLCTGIICKAKHIVLYWSNTL